MSDQTFTEEQQNYLRGFMSGLKAAAGASSSAAVPIAGPAGATDPEAAHRAAQDRVLAAGKKLSAEEVAKRDTHPFDIYDRMKATAKDGKFPKGVDVFRWKFHGLFYVAPAEESFMCRLRIPNGILRADQLDGLADLASRTAGGYAHVTTRANLQLREIAAENGVTLLEGLYDLGLTARGSGADNVRNITGSPTAGIDPDELIDTRPLARELHFHILNRRELYGLPRKFNIAFDGGGRIAVLEDTNDIAFRAIKVGEGQAVPAGIYFRMGLGGITGHGDFARGTQVVVAPDDCVAVAEAVLRVFIETGDRTDRRKARLKYVLDDLGIDRFLAAVEAKLGRALLRLPADVGAGAGEAIKHAHMGVHPQRQAGLNYIGVALSVGRVTSAQMRGLAAIARELGSGTLRLTVWQNLLISDIADANVAMAKARIEALGLDWSASSIRAGLIACTGNTGCKFAASDTKRHGAAIIDFIERRVDLDRPINVHLTGCHHSCAQHMIGDIGLLAAKIEDGEDEVEGYHVLVGGDYGMRARIGREIYRDVKAEDAPAVIARMLCGYLAHRKNADESFGDFVARFETSGLIDLFDHVAVQHGEAA